MNNVKKAVLDNLIGKVVEEIEDWIIISDNKGEIVYVNKAVYNDCGLKENDLLGTDICMFIESDLSDESTIQGLHKLIKEGEKCSFATNKIINNKKVYFTNSFATISDLDGMTYYICLSKNTTVRHELEEEIHKVNYFDSITRYPNHKLFKEDIRTEIKQSKIKYSRFAIMIMDIKGLERINHLYGLSIGDRVIKGVGELIKNNLSIGQSIYRYNGSSFAIIDRSSIDENDIINFIEGVNKELQKPIIVRNRNIDVSIRTGITFFDNSSILPNQLIEHAQIALSKSKEDSDYITYVFYSNVVKEEMTTQFLMEKDLQRAVENEEFIVYYQPFINLEDKELVGMEALIRRKKPNGEIVYPGAFIGILEKMKLIEKVGIQVLERVCRQLSEWISKGYKVVPISVNLSALQFKNPYLAKNIKEIIQRYNIPSKYIVLEITETMMMEDMELSRGTIEELKLLGFSISIDDFGTGYASIGYLKKFMFDHLKIDISFIRDIVQNNEDRVIVEAIIAIANTFKLHTIAEGIESEEQLGVMLELGCEIGQGYFWDKPISGDNIEERYFSYYQD